MKPEDQAAGRLWMSMLKPFDLGDLSLPSTTVRYRADDGLTTDAEATTVTLHVRSIRQAGASGELIPLRPPAAIPRQWGWLAIASAAVVICLLLAWALTPLVVAARTPSLL